MMIESLALLVIFVILMDTRSKVKRLERQMRGEQVQHSYAPPPRDAAAPWGPPSTPTSERTPARIKPVEPEIARPEPQAEPQAEPLRAAALAADVPPVIAEPVTPDVSNTLQHHPQLVMAGSDEPTAETPEFPQPKQSLASRFEILFGKKLPIWAGGITLAIAGVLIVKYAIDAGFFGRIFTHGVQVIAGLIFGGGLIAGAEFAWRNEARVQDKRVPQALSGAGIATLYAAILVAANAYHLISPLVAFAGLAVVTASALGLSMRFGAPSALLGLAGGLATPALVGSIDPNVPMLSVYLSLTIAGLVGVSRMQRWPWLALAALAGGAGWSLWMILASQAYDTLGSLSIGGFVLLLAIALPMFGLQGPRSAFMRGVSALVGAAQLALLVAYGGFQPLHWGLFVLLAAAGQWLAWRDKAFEIVPSISLGLAAFLLAVWPHPTMYWLSLIGLSLVAIHALPLLARLWQQPAKLQRAAELGTMALAIPLIAKWHFWGLGDHRLALIAFAAALIPATGILTGWRRDDRLNDARFYTLTSAASLLLTAALVLLTLQWAVPLTIGAVAAALLFFGKASRDPRIEGLAAGYAGATLPALALTMIGQSEFEHLFTGTGVVDMHALLRWGGLTALALLFAVRAKGRVIADAAQAVAAVMAYGTASQILPLNPLTLVAPLGVAAMLTGSKRLDWPRLLPAAAAFALVTMLWAAAPLGTWGAHAAMSLGGIPMTLDPAFLGLADVLRRLIAPALVVALALWLARGALPERVRMLGTGAVAILGAIGAHTLYRLGFAQIVPGDFAHTGLGERIVWEALLIGSAWLVARRGSDAVTRRLSLALAGAGTLHAFWYSLIVHNPLWATQAVGPMPLANLLIPAFAMVPLGLMRIGALLPDVRAKAERGVQLLHMLLVAGFAWAVLRHGFHGSFLTAPGVLPTENILRSILLLALAIGYLLWGIRAKRHDWRIASLVLMLGAVSKVFLFDASGLQGLLRIGSFLALGFSLIGIGWLYSRQLAASVPAPEPEA